MWTPPLLAYRTSEPVIAPPTNAASHRTYQLHRVAWIAGCLSAERHWWRGAPAVAEGVCDSHESPPVRERDRPSRNSGHSASSHCGRARTVASAQLAPGTPWRGFGRPRTPLRAYESDWQILWQTRLPALGRATGRVLAPGLCCWFVVEPPPESNRGPHPYHSCCRAPVIGAVLVRRP
jgi:hypothetical protein